MNNERLARFGLIEDGRNEGKDEKLRELVEKKVKKDFLFLRLQICLRKAKKQF